MIELFHSQYVSKTVCVCARANEPAQPYGCDSDEQR